jgi:hypothetical protein
MGYRGHSEPAKTPTLADSFGRLPRLNTIRISVLTSREIIKALTAGMVNPAKKSPDSILFRMLREGVAFSPHGVDHSREEDLQHVLMQRYQWGAPIQHLQFNFFCFLTGADIVRFSEIVLDVYWDEWSKINFYKLGHSGYG